MQIVISVSLQLDTVTPTGEAVGHKAGKSVGSAVVGSAIVGSAVAGEAVGFEKGESVATGAGMPQLM